jgi:hypothetical protein
MTLTKSRRVGAKTKAVSALPDLTGRWSEAEIKALTDEMIKDLDDAEVGASSAVARNGLRIVAVAAWVTSQRQRSEEWLRLAFARIEALERELNEAKAAPRLTYKGPWRQGVETLPGEFVTFQGSVWHCNKKTMSRPSDDPAAYTLAVKAGRDGKDSRP